MKVYFGTSPRIKEEYLNIVIRIYKTIADLGHKHTSNWVKEVDPKEFYKLSVKDLDIHQKKTIEAIKKSEVCVFEVSRHSLSVGYLVNYALENGKVVILLGQHPEPLTLFRTIQSERLITMVYKPDEVEDKITDALEQAESKSDVRFNFFVSPQILTYLDFVSQKRMIPRSVFLRSLIEREMKKDKDFKVDQN